MTSDHCIEEEIDEPGFYLIKVFESFICTSPSSRIAVTEQPSIQDPEAETGRQNLEVYPNPVDDSFTIEFALEHGTSVHMALYDLQGKVVWSQMQHYEKGRQLLRVAEANELPSIAGAFVLKISSDQINESRQLIFH